MLICRLESALSAKVLVSHDWDNQRGFEKYFQDHRDMNHYMNKEKMLLQMN